MTSLDLTLNEIHGKWATDVAPVLKKLPNLSSLSLALNRLHGDLTCVDGGDDADSNGKLAVVAVTANALTGVVPACYVGGGTVELHASRNAFTALPDIKKGAAKHLRVLAVAGDDHHGSMRQACQTDIAKLCPDVQPGGGRILQCFRAHKDALSDGCKSALMAMLAEHRAAAGDASAPH